MLSTLEKVTEIVREQAPDVTIGIDPAHRISQDLGIDSMTIVEILIRVQEIFGIEVSDHELDTVHSIQDILDLVALKA